MSIQSDHSYPLHISILELLRISIRTDCPTLDEPTLDEPLKTISDKSEFTKILIERRYKRLGTVERRPSLEYLSSENILEVFLEFVHDKERLLKMTKLQLQDLYNSWYRDVYLESRRE
jgi:hypothetical protein